jgi:hypothetical protein
MRWISRRWHAISSRVTEARRLIECGGKMPLILDAKCPDEKEGDWFWGLRTKVKSEVVLVCEECWASWRHPNMFAVDRVIAALNMEGEHSEWAQATWDDIERAGWNKRAFRYSDVPIT